MRLLLAQARAGNQEQLGRLLEILRPYLLATAARNLSNQLRAKVSPSDLVQETLIEAGRDLA